MANTWSETLSGFRAFVQDLKEKGEKDSIEYLFSLTTFDTLIEEPIQAKAIADVSVDALVPFGPRGSTALYDAVGKTLEKVQTAYDGKSVDKFIGIIVTDGQENSSREWTKDALNSAIDTKLKAGNWTFTYLGTQPETWDDATSIGVGAGATATYTPSMARAAYAATSHAVHAMADSSSHGTRSLLSTHGDEKMMRAAGMTTGNMPNLPPQLPSPAPPKTVKPRTPGKRSWR